MERSVLITAPRQVIARSRLERAAAFVAVLFDLSRRRSPPRARSQWRQ